MRDIFNIFRTPTVEQRIKTQLRDALERHLEHSLRAEEHKTLCEMYAARAERLQVETDKAKFYG
jgi:hypothetical protein